MPIQVYDLAVLLAIGLALMAFRWTSLLVPSVLLFAFADEMLLATGVSLFWSLVFVKPRDWLPSSFRLLAILISLSFLSFSAFGFSLSALASAVMPWVLYPWLKSWLLENSGAVVVWVTMALLSLVRMSGEAVEVSMLEIMSCYFFFIVAWYRQIPPSLLSLSMLMGCLVLGAIALLDMRIACWVAAVLVFQLIDKWRWGGGDCMQSIWAWALGLVLPMTLMTGGSWTSGLTLFEVMFTLLLLWLAQQEACRLCVATARCREVVVSLMGARVGVLLWIFVCHQTMQPIDISIVAVVFCLSESARLARLLPVREQQILSSPCKGQWAMGLRESLR